MEEVADVVEDHQRDDETSQDVDRIESRLPASRERASRKRIRCRWGCHG
jgi:hypothetical protein